MTPELLTLALAALFQTLQFVAFSIAANLQVGPGVAMGPRDDPPRLTGVAGRLQRAMTNHFEGLILFTIAVVVVTVGNQSTPFTAACGWVYLIARVLYIPAYVFGWVPWRSAIWLAGFGATVAMLVAALL